MDFKLGDLIAILPDVQRKHGDDFVTQIGQIADESPNIQQLENGILSLFNSNGLNYSQIVAQNSVLKAGEIDNSQERTVESQPIQNELIFVVGQKIEDKAEESFDLSSLWRL